MGTLGNVQFSIQTLVDVVHESTTNFDGENPEGMPVTSTGTWAWSAGTSFGLVKPSILGINDPLHVVRLQLHLAGQDTWLVELVESDGVASTVASGTTETIFNQSKLTFLMPGQALRVTTAGASTTAVKMVCGLANPNFYTSV